MRHAAVEFAERVDDRWQAGERWDIVFCTDMLNVGEWKGLLRSDARDLPVVLYFHENQLAYPDRENNRRDLHYAFTNFTSSLAAKQVWFNSAYNRRTLLDGLDELIRRWPDFPPRRGLEAVRKKSVIQFPGIELGENVRSPAAAKRLHVIWAARWEHDKNPEELLELLDGLHEIGIDFEASVVGQQFTIRPSCFTEIHRKHRERIVFWGYQEARREYLAALRQADIFLSTARHEFFGLATAEAIAAGCIPVVPRRLAYPELLDTDGCPERDCLLYDTIEDAIKFIATITAENRRIRIAERLTEEIRSRLGWQTRAAAMDRDLARLARRNSTS